MVSKNQIKLITSLQQKKFRQTHKLFIAEGAKVIQEFLQSNFVLEHLFVTETIFTEVDNSQITTISESDLKKITCLATPNNCLALFKIPDQKKTVNSGLIVALDDIRDPGNLGTIIRLCDWFGVSQIICSEQTVDVYNPKVIQATMGSISRVSVSYLNLENYIKEANSPVYGTFMDGKNVRVNKDYSHKQIVEKIKQKNGDLNSGKIGNLFFETPELVKKKSQYILNQQLAGIFIFELTQDTLDNDTSLLSASNEVISPSFCTTH